MMTILVILGFTGQVSTPPFTSKPQLRCGAYCLYIGLNSLDIPVGEFTTFESKLGQPTPVGYSMQQLAEAASSFGAHASGVETSIEAIASHTGNFACIALLEDAGHYVCIYDVDSTRVYVVDPPNDIVMSRDAFAKLWAGKALLISDRPLGTFESRRHPIWFVSYVLVGIAVSLMLYTQVRRVRRRG